MKPASLLPKYLLAIAAVCAIAVGLTALGHYVVFSDSGDAKLPFVSSIGRPVLIAGGLVAVVAALSGIVVLAVFALRQVRAIRALILSVERLADGLYEVPLEHTRADELGTLARVIDRLRETLRTTSISRDYLDKVLGSMSEAVFVISPEARITRVNPAASRLLDHTQAELVGEPLEKFVAASNRDAFRIADGDGRSLETTIVNRNGQELPISFTIAEIQDSNPSFRGFIVAARNITEKKIAEQRIRYLARIDALTKVANRMQFQHLLQRAIARAHKNGRQLALLYIDVDRFKDINDIYGHAAGDLCLESLAERLVRMLPDGAVVGRFAGDEFGVILEAAPAGGDQKGRVVAITRALLGDVAEVIEFSGQQIHMTASIGIATYPTDAKDVISLIRSADSALYQAKHAGGDCYEFFAPELNAAAAERLMLKSRLRRAYERNELLMNYQPKVDLRTGLIAGAEALVRWELSERGIVLPSEFIPLAEESNLILDIGEWVLDRVCQDFRIWQSKMLFPGRVSVNLSLKQLRQPNFTQRVGSIFRRYGVPPASLELEITETTLMENPERTVRILDELYNMGLSLAIDDFGTGYSSLSALQKFPISTLKIDQSFVRNAAVDADDATIVSTIIKMGHSLNLDVIAEGVESEEQLQFLRTAQCDYVQGLLFGKPMSAQEFMLLLASQRSGTPTYSALFA
jgi:diguanylate cyclase (GGDEF)-like protein/PAS domain S-box-containing protein